jgi:hypothetical protein
MIHLLSILFYAWACLACAVVLAVMVSAFLSWRASRPPADEPRRRCVRRFLLGRRVR